MRERQTTVVTGASGFMGWHLCAALVRDGIITRGTTRGKPVPPGVVRAHVPDVVDRLSVRRAVENVQVVVHLAAKTAFGQRDSADIAHEYHRVNVEGTQILLEESAAAGVEHFVLVSSVKAVGARSDVPLAETVAAHPEDEYGVTKRTAEVLVQAAVSSGQIRGTVLRFPLVYGPGMQANMLRLFQAVYRGLPLPFKAIPNRRSYVYVENAVAAIRAVVSVDIPGFELFHVTDDRDLSTPELIRQIARSLDRPARLFRFSPLALRVTGYLGDRVGILVPLPVTSSTISRLVESLRLDSSKIGGILGFAPPFSVSAGFNKTAVWFRESRHAASNSLTATSLN